MLLVTLFDKAAAVAINLTAGAWNPLPQVGNYTQLKQYWGHVEDLTGPNPTYSANITDGASDLGGQVWDSSVDRHTKPKCRHSAAV